MIAIVDYGMGNLGSVANMFKKVGVLAQITSDPDVIMASPKILLPGVGSFDSAMQRINSSGLKEVLDYKALVEKIPILGICLGMQLLMDGSEEGELSGLGWIPGMAYHFKGRIDSQLKVPHMGWNVATVTKVNGLTENFNGELRYYFVHSYFVRAKDPSDSIMRTKYGVEFDSAVASGNVYGAQFHPEKSHKFGMRLFENFAKIKC
ncbi:imidazole glycerol phosphate synthase subunit HisH [Daejeonella sp.]|uniref:imidazole glycerol phosphate synthase subunit HisH n=1 Tax=Daejeonella sp. TaxID=2805397 RepID=UPI002721EA2A|nr:imidazole glycerol phosphate synthase subunit HisH [Daejeonella sp.]MDO8994063.1 imidazole glycerol phosphate synthase subunit HisH [Daejeonella sp.]MDP2414340.1 imidazole glycerol phosphate synthase subunit HisH [Daejeonella sp.]